MGERRPEALARAIDLGVAMQFSNIARDVEEDAALGRRLSAAEWLHRRLHAHCGRGTAGWSMRQNSIYDRAAAGIAMLPRSCRASINAARLLYREIGLEAQTQRHQGRAVVPHGRKLALVLQAIAQTPLLPRSVSTALLCRKANFCSMPSPMQLCRTPDTRDWASNWAGSCRCSWRWRNANHEQ